MRFICARRVVGFPFRHAVFLPARADGGGKTWLAAKSVALVNRQLLRCEHSVILWLVPSKPIREQTLRALRDRQHPALREAGPITVMDLDEAKSVTRATLDTSTTVIVATRQAFQVEDEALATSSFASTTTVGSVTSIAPRSLPAPAGSIRRRRKDACSSGSAIWCGARLARSSCRKRMAASIPILSAD